MIKYTYKGVEHTVQGDTTTLTTSGKYCEDNISIEASGGITPTGTITITTDGTYDVTNYATADVQTSIPPQMDDVDDGGVVFINYNGDVLYQYNTANMQLATELPALPNNQGFKEETWNWTLAEIKSHLTTYPNSTLTVGVNLVPTDEKTHIFYQVKEDTKTIYMCLGVNGTVTIEWGDGSSDGTLTGSSLNAFYYISHTYSSTGIYEIKFSVNGSARMQGGSGPLLINYSDTATNGGLTNYFAGGVKKLYIGKNVEPAVSYPLGFRLVEEMSLPNNFNCASSYILYYNQVCRGLVIPKPTSAVKGMSFVFAGGLEYLSLPATITTFDAGSIITAVGNLKYLTVTGTNTTLPNPFLNAAYSLRNLSIPNTITTMTNNMGSQSKIKRIKFPSSVTNLGTSSLFSTIYACKSIDLSNLTSVTDIPNSSFSSIASCEEVKLPPNLQTIGTSCFSTSNFLKKVVFPSTVTSIANFAFQSPNALMVADFRNATSVPSLGGTSAFQTANAELKIVVPDNLYSSWITTTNWTGLASKIVKASDYSD